MVDDSAVKIMQSLGLDINPAINSTIKFGKTITDLQTQLIALKSTAGQTAKDINASFSAELNKLKSNGLGISSKDVNQSKIIFDQYGNTLVEVGKKADNAKDKQAKLNKELAELIHLRKTQQIDAQTFVEKASPYRTDSTTWVSLQKQEQEKLVKELTSAEKEHQRVLNEKLKVENAINSSQKESVQEIKQSTLASMNAQAATLQQKAAAKGLSDEYKAQATLIRNQITVLQQKLATEGKLSAEEVKQTAQLKEQLSILKSQQKAEIAGTAKQTPNILGNEFQRRSSWFLTGGLFYGAINSGKEAVQTISEVESGVTDIARVMEDSTFVFTKYRDELIQLGVDYGQTFDIVQDIALRWAQAGYNVSDSIENTKTSLLALNTAELDAANATESMIGIMSQWQLTAKDLPLMLDKINKTADDFTVTSQDLVDGLLRSSGAAKIMGLSIDQTISLLTVMREASGRTGREVGNALNSILSYVQRPSSIKTFEQMGIKMFADEARTQFRNVMDIFEDVASKWDTVGKSIQDGFIKSADEAGLFSEEMAAALGMQEQWNDLQQRDLSQAAAGVYRRNYFIGMIERMSGAQEVLNNMTDAAGYSQAENARTMETLEKKYESLKAAAQQLAIALGDAGLLDILKGLTETATDAAGSISKLDPELKTLLFTALELLAVTKSIQSVGGLLGVNATLSGAMGQMAKLSSAAAIAPGWTKLIPLIIGATGAITLYVYNLQNASTETRKFKQRQDEIVKSYESKIKAAEESEAKAAAEAKTAEILAKKLDELTSKEKLNNVEKAQMKTIVDQLNQTLPSLGLKIDDHTGKIIGNTSAIYDNITALKNQAIAQAYQTKASASAEAYVQSEINLGQAKTKYDELKTKFDSQSKFNPVSDSLFDLFKNALGQDGYVRLSDLKDLEKTIAQETTNLEKYQKEIDEYTSKGIIKGSETTTTPPVDGEDLVILYKGEETKYVKPSEVAKYLKQGWSTTYIPKTSGDPYENPTLDNALKQLDHKKNINQMSIQDELSTLKFIQKNYVKTADERMDLVERIYDAEQRLKDEQLKKSQDFYNKEENYIQHWANLGLFSIERQIDEYKELYKIKTTSQEEEYRRTENLANLYKKLLNEEQQAIKDAYDERIDLIEADAKKKKEAQDEVIKGIEKELKLLDRNEETRDYNNDMADLQKERDYWSVRTGEEARKKLADINKEIAEKDHDREIELQKQTLEDKKQTAQDEINAIEKAANDEKDKWETSYKLIQKAFGEHSTDIIAIAGTMSEKAYEKWVDNYLTPLQNALKSGSLDSFEDGSGKLQDSIGKLPSHDWGMSDKDYQDFINNGQKWAALQEQGFKEVNSKEMQKLRLSNDELRKKYGKDPSLGEYPKFHTGGKALSDGNATLKKGEIVFPPNLSAVLERFMTTLKSSSSNTTTSSNISNNTDRRVIFNAPLFNSEQTVFEDDADEQSLAGELQRAISRL